MPASHSKRSLSAVFHTPGQKLELRQIATPVPQGEEVLVRVLGCTLCGSDLHSYDGRREVAVPTILGHEIVGEIDCFGDSASRRDLMGQPLQVGDRITWSIVANCGTCFFCLRGLPQKCLAAVKYGHERLRPGRELAGGLSEHCLLAPGTALVRLPEAIPLATACPASCATATIAAAVKAAGELSQANVCLYGLGLLGLTATAMLQVAGASQITCVDVNQERRTRAGCFGATHAVSPSELEASASAITKGHGFDVILELSGSTAAFESAWQLVRRGGVLVLVGAVFPTPPVSLQLEQIVRRNLTIHGVHNYAPRDLLTAVRFLEDHHQDFPFAELVDTWLPLEAADEAFRLAQDSSRIRVGVAGSR